MADSDNRSDCSDDEDGGKGRNKSRRELPAGAVATLKAWLLSPEHFTHPYPTPQDQVMLMQKTGIDKKQLKNWFTNARRRIWKPMLKKQLEQGKLAPTGPNGGVAVPGVVPGLMLPVMAPGMEGQLQYQQSIQSGSEMQQQVRQTGFVRVGKSLAFLHSPFFVRLQMQVDQYGNPIYTPSSAIGHPPQPAPISQPQYYEPNVAAPGPMPMTNSIGSLAQLGHSGSGSHLSKTDSHAVLMELFARDQDLVRQATESAGLKKPSDVQLTQPSQTYAESSGQPQQVSNQHPINLSKQRMANVPTLNSWPHFSSVSSLNNLGTMPGVKSITSLSGADLARQGPVNTIGNLAQVKSVESMGKNDSYAFLEVFFGDRSSTNLNQMVSKDSQRGVKRERDEDNDVGLSLDDESPFTTNGRKDSSDGNHHSSEMSTSPFSMDNRNDSSGTLKQAFDAAVAARGLMSVSRSSEKLTDLALPAKIQRTLSQEFMRQQQESQQQYTPYQYSASPAPADQGHGSPKQSLQYPGQHPGQHQPQIGQSGHVRSSYSSDPSDSNNSVEVPSATKCAICHQTNVDTQLRPCGHMFHERCLKPSLQAPMGPPKCPVDHVPILSALLAVPTDEVRRCRHSSLPLPTASVFLDLTCENVCCRMSFQDPYRDYPCLGVGL